MIPPTPSPRGNLASPRGNLSTPRGQQRALLAWRFATLVRIGPWIFLSLAAFLSVIHLQTEGQGIDWLASDSVDLYIDSEDRGQPTNPHVPLDLPMVENALLVPETASLPVNQVDLSTIMESYSPSRHPILDPSMFHPDSSKPIAIRFLTGSDKDISSESKFLIEAIERSKYLKLISVSFLGRPPDITLLLVNNVDRSTDPVLWMVDFLSIGRDCHSLEMLTKHAKDLDSVSTYTQLILLDYSASWNNPSCPNVEQLVPNIRLAKRGIVQSRHWEKNWVELGTISPNLEVWTGAPALYMPHTVRQVFVDQIQQKRPYDLKRETDVIHFWRKGDSSHYTQLRAAVSTTVASLQGKMAGTRKIRALVRTFGEDEAMEDNIVQSRYVEETLNTKIIVVAQRDEYEDHYRLMESIASGAMVMTDVMLGLPAGFQDKKNIVVYDSAETLKEHLYFYLNPKNEKQRRNIAMKGWEMAMTNHRSWHRVEELLFGKPVSKSRKPDFRAPEKRKRTKIQQNIQLDMDDSALLNNRTMAVNKREDD